MHPAPTTPLARSSTVFSKFDIEIRMTQRGAGREFPGIAGVSPARGIGLLA
jgi:hypothetical protein